MRIITQPRVYLVGRTSTEPSEIDRFLKENEVSWTTDTSVGGEQLCEMAGRTCYMSFGKGRKTNADYLGHIIGVGHGSVLEHATWNFLITGVSRSFTHELIRHRAGFGYSQLSQRYVDESDCDFVEPDCIAQDEKLHAIFLQAVRQSHEAYVALVEGLAEQFKDEPDGTLRRKLARQAARSVLPNATETKIFVTGNARGLRHFIEMRASEYAETEIRAVAVEVLRILQKESPSIFGDYHLKTMPDGSCVAETEHRKV
ncbi:MAG: FAD-dependent thymidylate synthase [Phycisphaerales bacterium]|nr:FAD-dependent thymidylate synthase [Phycisphaerales bacterium]